MALYGPGGDPPTVTPSGRSRLDYFGQASWPNAVAIKMPANVPMTGYVSPTPSGQLPGPSYVQPPGPLADATKQHGYF